MGHTNAAGVEFSPAANISGMTHEAKRHLQASITPIACGSRKVRHRRGGGGWGSTILRVRLVEVATGRVAYAGEIAGKGTRKMNGTGVEEMQSNVLRPAIARLVQELGPKL